MSTLVNAYSVSDEIDSGRVEPSNENIFVNFSKSFYSFKTLEKAVNNGYLNVDKYLEYNHTLTSDYFESENGKMGYWLYNPNLPKLIEQLPLIVSLHSGNGTGNDLNSLINRDEGFCSYLYNGKTYPLALILCPQSSTGWWYKGYNKEKEEVLLKELIDFIVEEYSIDKSRIYITGVSRGGCATFDMVIAYPDFFAAAMPIASAVYPYTCKDIKTPMRIYHGQYDLLDTGGKTSMGDSVVYAEKIINENGGNCELIILQGMGHTGQFVYWDSENYDAMEWMLSQINSNVA